MVQSMATAQLHTALAIAAPRVEASRVGGRRRGESHPSARVAGDGSRSPRPPRRNDTGVYRDASYRIQRIRRHAHAVELAREGVAINIIQRQLGHTRPGHHQHTYLQGIDPSEIIDAVRSRHQPTISATAGLTL